MQAAEVDYFENHGLKLRFPWRLYHAPIVAELQRTISQTRGTELLNLGSGPFLELAELREEGRRFTLCDIDARAIAAAKKRHGRRLAGADVVSPGAPLPYPNDCFDAVVSMDVIEHLPEPLPWLREALRVLKPGGQLFLTTPNYGSRSLRLIEATALEAIARLQHFSRKQLHPTKLDRARLLRVMDRAGAAGARVEPIAFNWVLTGRATKGS